MEELMEQIFSDENLKKQAEIIAKDYLKPENRSSSFMSLNVPVQALNALIKICERDSIGIIILIKNGITTFNEKDKVNILFLSTQENVLRDMILEAEAVSGTLDELSLSIGEELAKKDPSNPLYMISNVDPTIYKRMKENIKKLPPELRFTLFPEDDEEMDSHINVSFFTKTVPVTYKTFAMEGKKGPYLIPKIASIILACSLLDRPSEEKDFEEILDTNKKIMDIIMDLYFDEKPLWLVPGRIDRSGRFVAFSDKSVQISELDEENFNKLLQESFIGVNDLLVPISNDERNILKLYNEKMPAKELSFFKENHINKEFKPPEKFKELAAKETLIDMLNRKREQMLTVSDDFNGQNLTNLEDYIYASVNEMVIREDEDWHQYLTEDEITDAKEELLQDMKDYKLQSVNKENNQISQMIKETKDRMEAERAAAHILSRPSRSRSSEEREL